MTKGDYNRVAQALRSLGEDAAQCFDDARDRQRIATRFANILGKHDPKLDKVAFIRSATGLTK